MHWRSHSQRGRDATIDNCSGHDQCLCAPPFVASVLYLVNLQVQAEHGFIIMFLAHCVIKVALRLSPESKPLADSLLCSFQFQIIPRNWVTHTSLPPVDLDLQFLVCKTTCQFYQYCTVQNKAVTSSNSLLVTLFSHRCINLNKGH